MSSSILAWHFVDKKLRDGRAIPKDGVKLIHQGKIIPCVQGLHASISPFDALQYAPGTTLCLVECSGQIIHQQDKLVCTERTIIKRKEFSKQLYKFAKQQALSVIHLWDVPKVVIDYLNGDDSKRSAAESAAESAAWGAARNAAWGAARSAAWGAAESAARNAAWGAARSAAWGAAESAAESAARNAAWGAARSAAESAAESAAWNAARNQFNSLVYSEFGMEN